MTMVGDRIYILEATDKHLEIFRCDTGIAIHAPALVSVSDAKQIANGIYAILHGSFDRACSEETLRWDLERRQRKATTPSLPFATPTLESL